MTKNRYKNVLMDILDILMENHIQHGNSEADAVEYVCRLAGLDIKEFDEVMSSNSEE